MKKVFKIMSLVVVPWLASSGHALTPLSDADLSNQTGQALLSLSYMDPNDSSNLMKSSGQSIGFYKVGIEGQVDINANIRNLQLGCGGVNGAGSCDIDIKNLALSGLGDGVDASGSPTFSNGRATTDAVLKNPFMQFAIKNPNSASTRQVVGIQLGAAAITGLLTAGLTNSPSLSATDGIQTLSGYLQLASLTGEVGTQATTFGAAGPNNCGATVGAANGTCQAIAGKLNISNLWNRDFVSYTAAHTTDTQGISVPGMTVPFSKSATSVITGSRLTSAVVNNIGVSIPQIALDCARSDRASAALCGNQAASNFVNQLGVDLIDYGTYSAGQTAYPNGDSASCVSIGFCIVSTAKFQMGSGSTLNGLNLNVTFSEALNMFHNIPLRGTGGYLSLQNQAMRWPGANADDVANPGWWMSFKDPIDLGYLKSTDKANIDPVLPQVAGFVTQALMNGSDIYVDLASAAGAVFDNPIVKTLNIDVSSQTANLTLSNLQLTSQSVTSNCYGTLKFC